MFTVHPLTGDPQQVLLELLVQQLLELLEAQVGHPPPLELFVEQVEHPPPPELLEVQHSLLELLELQVEQPLLELVLHVEQDSEVPISTFASPSFNVSVFVDESQFAITTTFLAFKSLSVAAFNGVPV